MFNCLDCTRVDGRSFYIEVPPSVTGNFGFSCNFSSLGLVQGRDIATNININRTGGHDAVIDLSMVNLPNGITYEFVPETINIDQNTSILAVSAANNTVPNTYPTARIVGNDGDMERILNLPITVVEPYTLSIQSQAITIPQGGSDNVTIGISKIGGFNESITFTVNHAIIGQGDVMVNTVFEPNAVPWDNSSCTLSLNMGSAVPADVYQLQIRGIIGTMVKTTELELTVEE